LREQVLMLISMHTNGKIWQLMNKPLPKNAHDVQNEVREWKVKLAQQYDTFNDPMWRIRVDLISHIANHDDHRIADDMIRLSLCRSRLDMYQHLAFLKRIALRFGNKKWFVEFDNRQVVWLAQHR
jgi:hypothetical protein